MSNFLPFLKLILLGCSLCVIAKERSCFCCFFYFFLHHGCLCTDPEDVCYSLSCIWVGNIEIFLKLVSFDVVFFIRGVWTLVWEHGFYLLLKVGSFSLVFFITGVLLITFILHLVFLHVDPADDACDLYFCIWKTLHIFS